MQTPQEGELIDFFIGFPADVENIGVIIHIGRTDADFGTYFVGMNEGPVEVDVQTVIIRQLSLVELIQHYAGGFVDRDDVGTYVCDVVYVGIPCLGLCKGEAGTVVPSQTGFPTVVASPVEGGCEIQVVAAVEVGSVYNIAVVAVNPVQGVCQSDVKFFVIVFEGNVSSVGVSCFQHEFIVLFKHLVAVDVGQT